MEIREIAKKLHREYIDNGYEEMWNKARDILKPHGLEKIVDLAEVGLIVTEVSEIMEEIRKKKTSQAHLKEECADTIIRVINFMNRKEIDVETAILYAHVKNLPRGNRHGKAI